MVFGPTTLKQCDQLGAGTAGGKVFSFIAIGSGAVAASTVDTVLGGAITSAPRVGYVVTNSTTVSGTVGAIAAQSAVFTFVSAQTVQESGIVDSNTASGQSHLYARQTFTPINVLSGDQVTITWQITTG
jgi:hypothetical protein